jgi:Mlc titration factor MtfA (ptsG expression regulator)
MSAPVIFAVFATTLLAGSLFYLFFYRTWRRKRELQQPFPKPWRSYLKKQVPAYKRLAPQQRKRLERLVQLFVSEKDYYGCDGFEVDDRVRVTIAGHACLLILERPFSDYDEVQSILVYPDVYRAQGTESDGLVVSHSDQVRAGEASSRGQVVLAWSECENAIAEPHSPHNVILHEFAHQLDYLDGTADGAPPLYGEQARNWQETMTKAWDHLQHRLEHHHKPWLDPYGATEPAEFFAVLTEAFFQQPEHLLEAQPEVYKAMCGYYRIDPRDFSAHQP